jgi:sporulation protein YlmC with PRC-barrel domain
MKLSVLAGWATLAFAASVAPVHAQVAGSTTVGVEVSELNEVALGWSAKKQILGHAVYNEKGEKVGKVDDLIIAPDKALSFAIIRAGRFAGLGRHDVAISVGQFQQRDGKLVLQGATKEAIRALPPFEYSSGK